MIGNCFAQWIGPRDLHPADYTATAATATAATATTAAATATATATTTITTTTTFSNVCGAYCNLLFTIYWYLLCCFSNSTSMKNKVMVDLEAYIRRDFMVKRSLMKSRLIKTENYKSRWFVLTKDFLCYCDGTLQVGLF